MWTIPNDDGSAQAQYQSQLDSVDLEILVRALGGSARAGVVTGCAVNAQGSPNMTVQVTAGLVQFGNILKPITAKTVTITTAHATLPRFDLIEVNASDAGFAREGTPAVSPRFPFPDTDRVVLASVFVPAAISSIAQDKIVDKRAGVPGVVVNPRLADLAKTSDNTIATDSAFSAPMAAQGKYLLILKIWYNTAANPDFKWRLIGPASPAAINLNGQYVIPNATQLVAPFRMTAYSTSDETILSGATGEGWLLVEGYIENGLNAGFLEFQWAQNTSNATATTVRGASYLQLIPVG